MSFRTIDVGDYAPNLVFADQDGAPASLVEIPHAGAFTAVARLVAAVQIPAAEIAALWQSLQPGFPMRLASARPRSVWCKVAAPP